ncbi:ABC transporter permease [Dyadobacter sandarakinus]|uniref:ABC transporter permease n=1 Tax=Dyadobacter sandarakinus TaxID=2747268 RepID=A0ABX7I6P0_9BACT|nr:ABC transporter permease [Dyadobacter sandarakinus]QRR01393.1 ABC transporter permease [Dyadobacter sandarakinus]
MIDINKEICIRISYLFTISVLCTISLSYLKFQLDYDCFHPNAERIYILSTQFNTLDEAAATSISSWTTASRISSNNEFVEQTARLAYSQIRLRGQSDFAGTGLFADASTFEVFELPLIHGEKKTALLHPQCIILTQDAALQLFGDKNPMGKSVFLEDFNCAATVTGVAKNLPKNSQIRTDAFISMATLAKLHGSASHESWDQISVLTYLLLKKNVPFQLAQKEVNKLYSLRADKTQELLLTKKNFILKPLRAALINPALTGIQVFSLCAASLILTLMLLSSLTRLIKIILLQISLSAAYMNMPKEEQNRKVIRKVFLLTIVISISSCVAWVGINYALKYAFDITVYGDSYQPVYFRAGLMLISILTSLLLCMWITRKVPSEPVTTYLLLKKQQEKG